MVNLIQNTRDSLFHFYLNTHSKLCNSNQLWWKLPHGSYPNMWFIKDLHAAFRNHRHHHRRRHYPGRVLLCHPGEGNHQPASNASALHWHPWGRGWLAWCTAMSKWCRTAVWCGSSKALICLCLPRVRTWIDYPSEGKASTTAPNQRRAGAAGIWTYLFQIDYNTRTCYLCLRFSPAPVCENHIERSCFVWCVCTWRESCSCMDAFCSRNLFINSI